MSGFLLFGVKRASIDSLKSHPASNKIDFFASFFHQGKNEVGF